MFLQFISVSSVFGCGFVCVCSNLFTTHVCVCVCVYDTGHRVSTMEKDEFHMNGSPPLLPLSLFSRYIHPPIHFSSPSFCSHSLSISHSVSLFIFTSSSPSTFSCFGPHPSRASILSTHLTFLPFHPLCLCLSSVFNLSLATSIFSTHLSLPPFVYVLPNFLLLSAPSLSLIFFSPSFPFFWHDLQSLYLCNITYIPVFLYLPN